MNLIVQLLSLYSLVIVARAVLSFFPLSYNSPMRTVSDFLFRITEPVFAPVRRVLPSTGMFDLSPLVVLLVIDLVLIPLLQSL